MSLRTEVRSLIESTRALTGEFSGQIVCPKCKGVIEWRYTDDGLRFFCNTNACVFSSEGLRRVFLDTEIIVNAPEVMTRRRSSKVMKKDEAEYRVAEHNKKKMKQAENDLRDGRYEVPLERDEWTPQNEKEKTDLAQAAFKGLETGASKFGPVIEKTVVVRDGDVLKQDPIEVRRIYFRGKKTPFWVSRENYESDRRWVNAFGPWPQIIIPDHLEDSTQLGWVEQPM